MADAPPSTRGSRIVFVEALRVTLGRPPVWLTILAVQLCLALVPALMFHDWFASATAHRYAPDSLFSDLSPTFRFDQRAGLEGLDRSIGIAGALLVAFAALIGCFSAGGWCQVFLERTQGESLRRFFVGGARYFWRFARLLVLTLATLAFFNWLVYGWPWQQLVLRWMLDVPVADLQRLETLSSEQTYANLRFVQAGLFGGAYALTMCWGDYTRTRLALHDTNSSLWAGMCTWATLVCNPVRTLRPMLGLLVFEAALLFGLGLFARSVEGELGRRVDWVGVGVLLSTTLLVMLWRVVVSGAQYHVAVQVSRDVVLPIARPDPWKEAIGGPGGPRYPIGGDEYTVSL